MNNLFPDLYRTAAPRSYVPVGTRRIQLLDRPFRWEYSFDWGRTWRPGKGMSVVPPAKAVPGQVHVRGIDNLGRYSDEVIGTPAADYIYYSAPASTGLNGYDRIIGYEPQDVISIAGPQYRATITRSIGNISALTRTNVSRLLTPQVFRPWKTAAFTVSGMDGTFVAMNDWQAGFKTYYDSLIFVSGYRVGAGSPIVVD
jgi:hypothetical protein